MPKTTLKAQIRPVGESKPQKRPKRYKNPNKALKRNLWLVFSRYIRSLHNKCFTCKDGTPDHCGHFLRNSERNQSLGGNALWYDERNFAAQCVICNNYNGGEQAVFGIKLEAKYGVGIMQELEQLKNKYKLWTKEEIVSLTEHYKELV